MNGRVWAAAVVALAFGLAGPGVPAAAAQDAVGGHIGVVLPLVSRTDGRAVTIGDDFVIGFPVGVTVRKSDAFTFDFELIPTIQNNPLHTSLTVHPGVLVPLRDEWNAGVHLAFDVNEPSWGFTPVLNHDLVLFGDGSKLFGEFTLPIRFQSFRPNETSTSIGFGVQVGIAFQASAR